MNSTASTAPAALARLKIAVVACGVSMLALVPELAPAAEFKASTPTGVKIDIGNEIAFIDVTGPIEPGDAKEFAALLTELGVDQYQMIGINGLELKVRLNSPGGSLSEAIEIARLIDTHKLQTFIARGSECVSACAVIFMAGTVQAGFRAAEERARQVEWPAKLGFHRPFIGTLALDIPPEIIAQLSADELEGIFNDQFLQAFDTANVLIQKMLSVDPTAWRPELLVRMLTATPSNADGEFVYLETVDDALTWDIDISNAVPPPSRSKKERFTENFWLCYNAGRAIPAYSGIWPEIAERVGSMESAEEILESKLSDLDDLLSGGQPHAMWDGRLIEDDGLTYYARVRGWVYGCTIRYEEIGGYPEITFVHDEATVTQTKVLQRYDPGLSLDEVVAARTQKAERAEVLVEGDADDGEVIIAVDRPASARCFVYRGKAVIDDEPCQRSIRTDRAAGTVEEYAWPSGSKTVLVRSDGDVSINGYASVADKSGRGDIDFCYRSEKSGNTFCFRDFSE